MHLFEDNYTVSSFLDQINLIIKPTQATIVGEISSFSFRRHCYFTLKDPKTDSVLNCFMWENTFNLMSINMEQGLEVIVRGYPEIYKPSGRLTFQTKSIELVGEGLLKKAYDALKKKLEVEGYFLADRKKMIPSFPRNIGVITSKNGAVIKDLLNNLGKYGFHISLYDSRVEGVSAVEDIYKGIEYFRDKSIDVLVLIRGGGSLESLQAFNNEFLIRSITDYPIPIICGIGHDKDVPLISLVADLSVSTPTAVAKQLNLSWDKAKDQIIISENSILHYFSVHIFSSKHQLEVFEKQVSDSLENIKHVLNEALSAFTFHLSSIKKGILSLHEKIAENQKTLLSRMKEQIFLTKKNLDYANGVIQMNNPKSILKKGFGIIRKDDHVISSIKDIQPNDTVLVEFKDGEASSIIKNKCIKEKS